MQPIKALTQTEPIDGLRFSVNVQPLQFFRTTCTWNYATFAGKQYFSTCGVAFNPNQDYISQYNDFLAAEYSGDKGINIAGSYIPIPQWNVILKGDLGMKNVKKPLESSYMLEARKMFGPYHAGTVFRHDSFGITFLHRFNKEFSYASELDLFVFYFYWEIANKFNRKISKLLVVLQAQYMSSKNIDFQVVMTQEITIVQILDIYMLTTREFH